MSQRKDWDRLFRTAERAGWRVERQRGGHIKCYPPDEGQMIVKPGSCSDYRGYLNARPEFRRAGLEV